MERRVATATRRARNTRVTRARHDNDGGFGAEDVFLFLNEAS
jgi:hypothetical protein